jgi:hypothetical protein
VPAVTVESDGVAPHEIAVPVTISTAQTFGSRELSVTEVAASDTHEARATCNVTPMFHGSPAVTPRNPTLLLRIDTQGRILEDRVESGSGSARLDRALLDCLTAHAVFTPRRNGAGSVPSWQRLHWQW